MQALLRFASRTRRVAIAAALLLASRLDAAAPMCEDTPSSRAPSSVGGFMRESVAGSMPGLVKKPSLFNGISVLSVDPKVSFQELNRYGFATQSWSPRRVHLGRRSAKPNLSDSAHAWQDPSPSLRESILNLSGLRAPVSGWDSFAKDRLFLRAQSYSLKRLTSKYPSIPRVQLESLQTQIRKRMAQERGE